MNRRVCYAFLLFVLQLAFGVVGPNPINVFIAGVIASSVIATALDLLADEHHTALSQ